MSCEASCSNKPTISHKIEPIILFILYSCISQVLNRNKYLVPGEDNPFLFKNSLPCSITFNRTDKIRKLEQTFPKVKANHCH